MNMNEYVYRKNRAIDFKYQHIRTIQTFPYPPLCLQTVFLPSQGDDTMDCHLPRGRGGQGHS